MRRVPQGTAHSSSGLGRHPLKVEITGSNPVCATTPNVNETSKLLNLKKADHYIRQLADPIERHALMSLFTTFLIYHQNLDNNKPQEDVDMLFIIKTLHYRIRDRDSIISILRGKPFDGF